MKYKRIGRHGFRTAAALAALWTLASDVRADQITFNNLTLPNVRITALSDGAVEYLSAGARRSVPLEDVSSIQFTRYPRYAEAMGQLETQPADAAETFGNLASSVREDFLRPLMRIRAAEALDRAGEFQDALEMYLEAVSGDASEYFVSRIPSNVPTGDEADAARRALTDAIRRARDGDVKAALQGVLDSIAQPVEDVPADATAVTPPAGAAPGDGDAADVPPAPATSVSLRTVENLIQTERYDRALEQIQRFLADGPPEQLLPELYYQRGRAEAGRGRHFTAALSLLRVPVHFSDHALAVPAMELAGHQLKADGQTEAARAVWQRAMDRTDDAAVKRRLMQAIDSL